MPHTVLHIVKALSLGGTEKVMQLMTTNLQRDQFLPVVCSLQDGERGKILRKEGITTYVSSDLFKVILTVKPDIIHVHRGGWPEHDFMRPIIMARRELEAKQSKHIPIIETNVFGRFDPTPSGKKVDSTLFVSHFCLERYALQNKIKADAPRYQVLYNPIDYDTIKANTLPVEKRDFSKPVVGRVSRADQGKWSALGLEFLPKVCAARPDFSYLVIGGIEYAKKYVKQHNLSGNVDFLPPFIQDADLAAFLDKISIFAHANDTGESFGLVIAEAMAAGLPVITHPCPGMRDNAQLELVDHERTGLIVNTAEEYADAILWLLNNPNEAKRMGKAGQEKAAQMYAAKVVVTQLKQIYNELLNVASA